MAKTSAGKFSVTVELTEDDQLGPSRAVELKYPEPYMFVTIIVGVGTSGRLTISGSEQAIDHLIENLSLGKAEALARYQIDAQAEAAKSAALEELKEKYGGRVSGLEIGTGAAGVVHPTDAAEA